jgi:predicted RNA methylase
MDDKTPQPVTLEEDDLEERASFGDWDEEEIDLPTLSFFSPPPSSTSSICTSKDYTTTSVTDDTKQDVNTSTLYVFYPSATQAFDELRSTTGFDVLSFASKRQLDDFGRIRLINYLRSVAVKVASMDYKVDEFKKRIIEELCQAVTESSLIVSANVWCDDTYLHPILETDGAISYALALSNEDQGPQLATSASVLTIGQDTASVVTQAIKDIHKNASVTSSVESLENSTSTQSLSLQSQQQQHRIAELEGEISRLNSILSSSKSLITRLTTSGGGGGKKVDEDEEEEDDDEEEDETCKASSLHSRPYSSDNDGYYFASYDKVSIHASMLGDTIRTEAYRDAILKNHSLIKDKLVLDVGCGTGILSLFAEQAGAKKVIALDNSNIINDAQKIISKNASRKDVILCKRGKAETLVLEEKVDIIISEWMGYALHYEGMLLSVLSARDRLLKPGGYMFPSRSQVFIGAYSDERLIEERVYSWENVYGFDMSIMRQHVTREPIVETLDPKCLVSKYPHCIVSNIDMTTCSASSIEIEQVPFSFSLHAGGKQPEEFSNTTVDIHGIALWFDIDFSGEVYRQEGGNGSDGSGQSGDRSGQKIGHESDANSHQTTLQTSSSPPPPPPPTTTPTPTTVLDTKSNLVTNMNHRDVDLDAIDGEDDMPLLEEIVAETAAEKWRRENANLEIEMKKKKEENTTTTIPPFVNVSFSTSPFNKSTHWHQTLLLFDTPLLGQKCDSILNGTFTMVRDIINPRELRFRVVIYGKEEEDKGEAVLIDQQWHMR